MFYQVRHSSHTQEKTGKKMVGDIPHLCQFIPIQAWYKCKQIIKSAGANWKEIEICNACFLYIQRMYKLHKSHTIS